VWARARQRFSAPSLSSHAASISFAASLGVFEWLFQYLFSEHVPSGLRQLLAFVKVLGNRLVHLGLLDRCRLFSPEIWAASC
jgi:hypothetical protein